MTTLPLPSAGIATPKHNRDGLRQGDLTQLRGNFRNAILNFCAENGTAVRKMHYSN